MSLFQTEINIYILVSNVLSFVAYVLYISIPIYSVISFPFHCVAYFHLLVVYIAIPLYSGVYFYSTVVSKQI